MSALKPRGLGCPALARGALPFLLLFAAAIVLALDSADESSRPPFRFAFSARMFSGVNENDAKAAVRACAQGLAKEHTIHLDGQPVILESLTEIMEAMRSKRVDCVSLTTDDYLALAPDLQNTNLLVSVISGRTTEQYLVLVHAKSGLSNLADLKGRRIVMLDHVRASLAAIWLEVLRRGRAWDCRRITSAKSVAPKVVRRAAGASGNKTPASSLEAGSTPWLNSTRNSARN